MSIFHKELFDLRRMRFNATTNHFYDSAALEEWPYLPTNCHRVSASNFPASQEEQRLENFREIYRDILHELKEGSTAPTFHSPGNVLRYIEHELVNDMPFKSKAYAEHVRVEIQTLLRVDPILSRNEKLKIAFQQLEQGAIAVDQAPTKGNARSKLAYSVLHTPLANAKTAMDSGVYFEESLNIIKEQVCTIPQKKFDISVLESTTRALIYSMLEIGYSVDQLAHFSRALIARVGVEGYLTDYELPIMISKRKYMSGRSFDVTAYREAMLMRAQSMSVCEKIGIFNTWYYAKPKSYSIVFRIVGLRGNRTFEVDEVTFFSVVPISSNLNKCTIFTNEVNKKKYTVASRP